MTTWQQRLIDINEGEAMTTRVICGSLHGAWDDYGRYCIVCHPPTPDHRDAEIARIKAEVADATARAEKAEVERDLLFDALNLHMRKTGITNEAMERVEAFRAVVDANEPLVRGECTRLAKGWNDAADARKAAEAERDAALAACAEMRAALALVNQRRVLFGEPEQRAIDDCLLSRPDLGAGMVVVPHEVVERWRYAIDALLHHRAHRSSCARCDPVRTVVVDLDALLKKGGG